MKGFSKYRFAFVALVAGASLVLAACSGTTGTGSATPGAGSDLSGTSVPSTGGSGVVGTPGSGLDTTTPSAGLGTSTSGGEMGGTSVPSTGGTGSDLSGTSTPDIYGVGTVPAGAGQGGTSVPSTGGSDLTGTTVPGGSLGGTSAPTTGGAGTGTSNFSAVDQAFVQVMIPHHEYGLALDQVAQVAAQHPELQQFAAKHAQMATQELGQMMSWQQQWGGGAATPMPMGGSGSGAGMSGTAMPSTAGVGQLAGAVPFDQAALDLMILQHQSEIEISQLMDQNGSNSEMRNLARTMLQNSQSELTQLQTWRQSWYGSSGSGTGGASGGGLIGSSTPMPNATSTP